MPERTRIRQQMTQEDLFHQNIKAVAYIRVSTEYQVEEGHSIAAQTNRIQGFCAAKGIDLVETFIDEGISGTVDPSERTGLSSAIQFIESGSASVLIVIKNDRVARRAQYQKDVIYGLMNKGFGYISISENVDTSTASGKLFLSMLAEFAEYEVELIRERTRAAIQHLKDTGQAHNKSMFGYKKEGCKKDGDPISVWVEVPEEQKIIKEIISLYDKGLSWAKVVQALKVQYQMVMHRNTARRIYLREKQKLISASQ